MHVLLASVQAAPARALSWQLGAGLLVAVAAAVLVARGVEVRLTLLVAALLLGLLAGEPETILRTFLGTFADEKFVVPICSALGFAYVLRHSGCDQHLVHLLLRPLQRARWLLLPGTIVVGYFVNLPIISQASTVVTLGPVVIPILRAGGISMQTTGAALLLGASIGGELLNPGAPELNTVIQELQRPERVPGRYNFQHCVERVMPLSLSGLAVATLLFWGLAARHERRVVEPAPAPAQQSDFRVNYFKALVPLLPLVFLYLASPALRIVEVPDDWLIRTGEGDRRESRLIGAAMLLGAVVAAATRPRALTAATTAFCAGAGFGFQHIISLIVVANCFGRGISQIGLAALADSFIRAYPGSLIPSAGIVAWAFALVCGSGMAATQSLFGMFAGPALETGVDPTHVGAVIAICAAAGRTMSPVAAVTLIVADLTQTPPLTLVRRVAPPLLAAVATVIVLGMLTAPAP
jgi:DcuC family C4-dicarboxylate transporter